MSVTGCNCAGCSGDVYVPSEPEYISRDDPIIAGRRWKRERDAAALWAAKLAQAIRDSGHVGPHLNCPLCEVLTAYERAKLRGLAR